MDGVLQIAPLFAILMGSPPPVPPPSPQTEKFPLSSAPEPKRRFIPSKWEAKRVVRLVRALRRGWITTETPKAAPKVYLLWDDESTASGKTQAGLTYIPAPKPKLPGHEESYHPPPEYLPSEEEKAALAEAQEEGEQPFVPTNFDAIRKVREGGWGGGACVWLESGC